MSDKSMTLSFFCQEAKKYEVGGPDADSLASAMYYRSAALCAIEMGDPSLAALYFYNSAIQTTDPCEKIQMLQSAARIAIPQGCAVLVTKIMAESTKTKTMTFTFSATVSLEAVTIHLDTIKKMEEACAHYLRFRGTVKMSEF